MSDDMKYVVVEKMGLEMPIVFPHILEHWEVAKDFHPHCTVSAGQCCISTEPVHLSDMDGSDHETPPLAPELKVSCWGQSVSLGKETKEGDASSKEPLVSRGEEDAKLIKRELDRWDKENKW